MAKRLLLPRISSADRKSIQLLASEIVYDKDLKQLFYGDGATAGGVPMVPGDPGNQYVYGIDYDSAIATASSACSRVVLNNTYDYAGAPVASRYQKVTEFTAMPAHNFRRCVMDDLENRHVNYYLNASNSNLKADGTPSVLTGADGDVMVEIPVTYYRIDTYTDDSNHIHKVYLVSNKQFTNSRPHPAFFVSPSGMELRTQYIGAFRSILCNAAGQPVEQTNPAVPVGYQTGYKFRSILGGRPATNFSQNTHRVGARLNGAQGINSAMGQFLMIMMAIDGCTWDTQIGISIGYCNAAHWNYMYVRPNGYTTGLGNQTGSILSEDGIVVNGTRFVRNYDSDYPDHTQTTAYGWISGSTVRYTGNPMPAVGGPVFSDNTLSNQAGNISEVARDAEIAWNATAISNTSQRVCAMSYRGIENAYGSQWCFEDGIQKNQDNVVDSITVSETVYTRSETNDSGEAFAWISGSTLRYTAVVNPTNGTEVYSNNTLTASAGTCSSVGGNTVRSGFWMTTSTDVYSDRDLGLGPVNSPYPTEGFTGQTYKWVSQAWPKYAGLVGAFDFLTFFPTALGGSTTTYLGDYFLNDAEAGARVVIRGGRLHFGVEDGLGRVNVSNPLTFLSPYIGSRLSA